MKKVLHLITGVEMDGGAEHMLLKTLPFLQSAEHAVCALKGRGKIGEQLENLGVKVFYLEAKSFFDLALIGRYKKVLNDFQPDIQVNYLIHADIFGRIFAKRFGVKKIVSYIRNRHTKFIFQLFDSFTLFRVDYLLANSLAVLDFYRRHYHFAADRSFCITNGIDLENKKPQSEELDKLKTELALGEEDFVLLTVASFKKQKDLPTLLRALALVKAKGFCQPRLLLCGEGKEKENLEQLVEVLGIASNVNFLGIRDDVVTLLSIANAFVLPSLHEGMSNALLEAMAESKSCIVSAIPENSELIKNKENGLTFQPGNETDLAEKIMAICASPRQSAAFGAKARETAQLYDIKKIIKELDDFFAARLSEKKKIIWIANDQNKIYLNFFKALGESHPELDLFLLAGELKAGEGKNEFYRWRIFPFAYRWIFKLFFLPVQLIAKLAHKKIDVLNLDYYRGLHTLLKKENPDLIMANLYLQPTSWQALWYCFIHRKPLLLLEEKKYFGRTRARRILSTIQLLLAAPLFIFAKKVYCYTSDGLNFGKKHFPVFNKAKIELLPASVDTRIFYNEHLNKDDDRLKILIVARMVPFKRYEDILQAVKVLKEKDQFDFILNIRGDGPLEGEINLLIDKLGIRDRINFIPPMSNEHLREVYNQNDILVLPSFNEPIGIVVPEAMACGLPVVISDTCGSKTYVKNGINGYIFKTFDHFDLAEKITMLAYDERRAQMAAAAGKTIKEEFDSRLIADIFFEKIKNLV